MLVMESIVISVKSVKSANNHLNKFIISASA